MDFYQYSIDPHDVAWHGVGTEMPLIESIGDTIILGFGRIRNGAVVTQTSGEHRWQNGSSQWAFNMYIDKDTPGHDPPMPPTLNIFGGKHIVEGRASIGADGGGADEGTATINIWGTGEFRVKENWFSELYALDIRPGSLIDIRDDGALIVPAALLATVQDYAAAGLIVAGQEGASLVYGPDGDDLAVTATAPGLGGDFDNDGDVDGNDFLVWQQGFGTVYEASDLAHWQANFGAPGAGVAKVAAAVPEPASAMLALLGLGLLAAARRRENRGI